MAKEGGGITSKLKKFFGTKQQAPTHSADGSSVQVKTFIITDEHVQSISKITPINHRDRAIQELTRIVESSRLEPLAPEALIHSVEDLLDAGHDQSRRLLVFNFVHSLIKGQYDQLGVLREYFFHLLIKYRTAKDHEVSLAILHTLTEGGHNLELIDTQIGALMVNWLNDITIPSVKTRFLQLLVNIIKYNAAFIDEINHMQLFKISCFICDRSVQPSDKELCMQVLESLLKYSYLRSSALTPLCLTLCRTVTQEGLDLRSWKLMQSFLGTHLGYSALFTINKILEDRNHLSDGALLKGAVFFISMALWGHQRVQSLQVSATAVLPAFKAALRSQNNRVAFEVSIAVLRLVRKYGKNQPTAMWVQVLDILDILYSLIQRVAPLEAALIQKVSNNVHDILTAMEQLLDSGQYNSSPDRLFTFIEKSAAGRPENSVMMLLQHRAESCRPPQDDWLENLTNLLDKYFKNERRPAIRLKALSVLEQILCTNKVVFEDPLIDLMIQQLSSIHMDTGTDVRQVATQLLISQAKMCITPKCLDIINVVHKVISREVKPNLKSNNQQVDLHCIDIKLGLIGLVELFKLKLNEPSGKAAVHMILNILTNHIDFHYANHCRSQTAKQIRLAVFDVLLDLHADLNGRVGSHMFCSESYCIDDISGTEGSSIVPECVLDFNRVLRCINECLNKESNWKVLSLVLEKMPKQWQNKTLILSADNVTIEKICRTLCRMLQEKLRHLYEAPAALKKPDFDSEVIPVLTCMTSYHTCLQSAKHELIRCLEFGLVTKCARSCIDTIRVCCMEMENLMMRMLPSILAKLNQISANKNMAMPLLIFLSCLVRLPKLYRDFNEDNYRLIFAIALPYTDPFRFTHFAVYLSYHVIAMWFVKCRLMYRKQFVHYIIKELQSNMKQFNSRASQDTPPAGRDTVYDKARLQKFHQELQETCIDFMARYTFSTCASVPKRTSVTEFLLEDGRSQTWFLGNKLITITTSGGGSKVTKTGLCQRCSSSVKDPVGETQHHHIKSAWPAQSIKRSRHSSAKVRTLSNPVERPGEQFAQDDIRIHRQETAGAAVAAGTDESSSSSGSAVSTTVNHNDELLTSLASNKTEGHVFNPTECNCWCNGWAEIYIRRPSGNTSWILRIQNQQLFNYEDFPLSDISSLFLSSPGKSPFDNHIPQRKYESGSLEEKEYEEVHDQHFHSTTRKSKVKRNINMMIGDEDSAFAVIKEEDKMVRNGSDPQLIPGLSGQPSAFSRQTSLSDVPDEDEIGVTSLKRRSHTISYSRPSVSPEGSTRRTVNTRDMRSGIDPAFVFLQLYHTGFLHNSSAPIHINESSDIYERSLKNLDRIAPYETHKVGVVYVAKGQATEETSILSNTYGSKRYSDFLKRIGTLLFLKDVDPEHMFVGGLDHEEEEDGKYTYAWHDEVVQMVFHVATLMPTRTKDPKCNNKKRHIGNDYVTIVYNDSGQKYSMGTIKGQFNYASIVIEPLDKVSNAVSIHFKDEIKDILGNHATKVIRDENLVNLVRQMSLHASMASHIHEKLHSKELYASNWLERLRQIKRMKEKVCSTAPGGDRRRNSDTEIGITDFTEYV